MKIELDENVTVASKGLLANAGHEVDSVVDAGIAGADDEQLAEVCAREGRLLVTFDLGLGDIRTHPPGTHPGVVQLRLRDQQSQATLDALRSLIDRYDLDTLSGAIAIVSEEHVRIRRV